MTQHSDLEIFLVAVPGLEHILQAEARAKGFTRLTPTKGGVTVRGGWTDVWRANLQIRGASKILVRLGAFRALHLAQLDKRARKFPWADFLQTDVPVRVEVSCKKSKIYHQRAAKQRIETAIAEELGAPIDAEADICLKVRILENLCTISVDTSGEGLHKRGHKAAVNKAPMRETLAALLLQECGYSGQEPVVDPMCGSGTFVIEAAEIAAGLHPGRTRSFAFEKLATFDETKWLELKNDTSAHTTNTPALHFYGFDRDAGAIKISTANAVRAGVAELCTFEKQAVSNLTTPDGPTGLVMINPPYGGRIGETKKLYPLYQALGRSLKQSFRGWRVGLVTNNTSLAKATGLTFEDKPLGFSHGGINVNLFKASIEV